MASLLERVLEIDPTHPVALNSLGMRALNQHDFTSAERLFARAIASDPQAPPLWMNLASARRAMGDDPGERAALLGALDIDQRHLMATVRLAELHERRGEAPAAAERWSNFLAISQYIPDLPQGLAAAVTHAQHYVAEHRAVFAQTIDRGLEAARSSLYPADRRRFDACIDVILGRRRVFFNECAGMHFPFLPADEFFDRRHFAWMDQIEAQTDVIRRELLDLLADGGPGLEPYVAMAPGTPESKWSDLDHSLDWSAYFLWKFGERMSAACGRCPATAAAVEALPLADMPRRSPTVFFSILKPRTRLPAHTGVTNTRAIVHLPLIVPPGCGFRVGGETREWIEGAAFAFDDTIDHEAWNDSDQFRAVLIFDVWNPHIDSVERSLLRTFFAIADESGLDPGASGRITD
ncbi:MAG: aspartyl/asparaginyl beta-hydroxylase domain-containing protein [Sphingomonas sp.]|nr:aspartyl/asparaginyl beta-hydroxylase domain-containing protein [Sphingomonas sp.]